MNKAYSPNKNKNFYTLQQKLDRVFYKFNKKKRFFIYDLLFMTLGIKIYHCFAANLFKLLYKINGFQFYLRSKFFRILLFSGIRGMSLNEIFAIRKEHFKGLEKKDLLLPEKYKNIVSEIRKSGYCDIKNLINITEEDIVNVNRYFRDCSLYDGHDPMQSSLKKIHYNDIKKHNIDHEIFNKGYFSYDAETSLSNKVINKLFYNQELKKIADYYCGFDTEPYTISTMLNIRKEIVHPVTQFHRDNDDFVFLGFFIYWSNTNSNNGATSYMHGSHRNIDDITGETKFIEVSPGTIIAGDWMGKHKGNSKMEDEERLITMIRYGKKFNHGYMSTKSYYFF